MLGAGDEVAERVVLVLLLAGTVPGLPQFTTTSHMGDGKGHAALQQAQAGMGEPWVEAFAVGAVAIEVQRYRLAQVGAALHQADRHLGTVAGSGPESLAHVLIGVEWAQHRSLFKNLLSTTGELQLAHLGRAIEGLVAQADALAFKLEAVLHIQAVGRIRQLHPVRGKPLWAHFDDR
ncbi:hypothetical protein D9M71_538560 [compost metagenome]